MAARTRKPDQFHLRLKPREGEGYPVLAASPCGKAAGIFALPFDERQLAEFLQQMSPRVPGMLRFETITEHDGRVFGERLFAALCPGAVRDVYVASKTRATSRRRAMRITLHVAQVPELAAVPWEYLHDGMLFAGIDKYTPIVRMLDVENHYRPAELNTPLRVL